MISIRKAASILAGTESASDISKIATALGFNSKHYRLNRELQETIGLEDILDNLRIFPGKETLRLLAADVVNDCTPREAARRTIKALEKNAPGQAWLICLTQRSSKSTVLATGRKAENGKVHISALCISTQNITDSDAHTFRCLCAVTSSDSLLTWSRWNDILGRDSLSTRFYKTMDQLVSKLAQEATGRATSTEKHTLALITASRMLFLAFLETKGWLDNDLGFIMRECASSLNKKGTLHQTLLRPLFFGTLNTPVKERSKTALKFGNIPFLNGGLFSPSNLEKRLAHVSFQDDHIVALIGELIDKYRFTTKEDSSEWSEAAIDPEMLGRVFESVMEKDERKSSGTFYTPPYLVERIVNEAIQATIDKNRISTNDLDRIASIKCLDPACGSGAFLVQMMHRLTEWRIESGDSRSSHEIRRDVLAESIFGVDISPIAVWLCELRLWLAVVMDYETKNIQKIPPLPNLDHNIRVGNTLEGGTFEYSAIRAVDIASKRKRYAASSGKQKIIYATRLNLEERNYALRELAVRKSAVQSKRYDILAHLRTPDLFGNRPDITKDDNQRLSKCKTELKRIGAEERRVLLGGELSFRFATHFMDSGESGGFDIVIGNPPWVRPHQLPIAQRIALRNNFRSMREAAWKVGVSYSGSSSGFASQTDLSAAFAEQSIELLKEGGVIAMLLPAKLWKSLSGGGIRRLISSKTELKSITDWSTAPNSFDAAAYPSLLVAKKTSSHYEHRKSFVVNVVNENKEHSFELPPNSISMGNDFTAPWIMLPPAPLHSFNALREIGTPLGESEIGRPMLGVKCGFNEAFLVKIVSRSGTLALIESGARRGMIEEHMLRPAISGQDIGSNMNLANLSHSIIWTHDGDGRALTTLPPSADMWLKALKGRLESRSDAYKKKFWWMLFRTDAAKSDIPRIVWADFGKKIRTHILRAGDPSVPLNTCYVLRTPTLKDAWAMDLLLSSPIATAWLSTIAEPARGGWKRFLGWTVSALPVPKDWNSARIILSTLGQKKESGYKPTDDEYLDVVSKAYGVDPNCLTPLISWFKQ